MEAKIWRLLVSLGVPGVALGVFLILFESVGENLGPIPSEWVGPIAIIFMILVSITTFYALNLWRPLRFPQAGGANSKYKANAVRAIPIRPQGPGPYHMIMICGLSSAGKDSVLWAVKEEEKNSPEKQVKYLTKYTSRELRDHEKEEKLRDVACRVDHISENELMDGSEYFGVYEREGNFYGFKRQQAEQFLRVNPSCVIVGIYSECEKLSDLKSELASYLGSSNIEINNHWVLIQAPEGHCERRLAARNLPLKTERIKKGNIRNEYTQLKALEIQGFFNYIIDNSDTSPFQDAVHQLSDLIESKLSLGDRQDVVDRDESAFSGD